VKKRVSGANGHHGLLSTLSRYDTYFERIRCNFAEKNCRCWSIEGSLNHPLDYIATAKQDSFRVDERNMWNILTIALSIGSERLVDAVNELPPFCGMIFGLLPVLPI